MKKRTVFLLSSFLLTSACAGLRDAERAQAVRLQELEARSEEASAKAAWEAGERAKAEAALQEARKQLSVLTDEQKKMQARTDDLSTRLNACSEREGTQSADLDLCRKGRAVCEEERGKRDRDLVVLRAASEGELQRKDGELESCRGRVADLEAQAGLLAAEKSRAELESKEKVEEVTHSFEELLSQAKARVAESEGRFVAPRQRACEEAEATVARLAEALAAELPKAGVLLERSGPRIRIGFPEGAFRAGGADLTPQAREVLGKLGPALKGVGTTPFWVGAFAAAERPAKKTKGAPGGWDLAAARAARVAAGLEAAGVQRGALALGVGGSAQSGLPVALSFSLLAEEAVCER